MITIKYILITSGFLLLVSCASPSEVLETRTPVTFDSSKSAALLTTCIDRNTDGAALNSLRTNIKSLGPEFSEIVVRNGDYIHSVVQVKATETGSVALFHFGGVAFDQQRWFERMTKGCA